MSTNATMPESHLVGDFIQIGIYSFLVAVGVPLNILTFLRASKRYHVTKVRIYLLQMNLNISDLMVLLFHAFFRVCWLSTYQFYGGPAMCKIMKFLDNLGLTFSSNVVVCIGFDRLFSLNSSSTVSQRLRRVKLSLGLAWAASLLTSAPQLLIWTTVRHPSGIDWYQCMALFQFPDENGTNSTVEMVQRLKTVYSLAFILISFWIPCLLIVLCYSLIFRQVSSKLTDDGREFYTVRYTPAGSELHLAGKVEQSKRGKWQKLRKNQSAGELRRNGLEEESCVPLPSVKTRRRQSLWAGNGDGRKSVTSVIRSDLGTSAVMCAGHGSPPGIMRQCRSCYSCGSRGELHSPWNNASSQSQMRIRRRRYHTLIVSSVLVIAYFACWLPYNVLMLWQAVDHRSYAIFEDHIYFLYGLIVLNSLVNPLIYGHLELKTLLKTFSSVIRCKS